MKDPKLSIIIPAYQEAERLEILLPLLFERNQEPFLEIIVMDASTDSSTLKVLRRTFQFCKGCTEKSTIDNQEQVMLCKNESNGMVKILKYKQETRRERSFLMNKGRKFATGNILFFLFADNVPPNYYSSMICNEFRAGYRFLAFEHEYQSEIPLMPLIEKGANYRLSNLSFFYGDHGIVICGEFFDGLGGFPDVPIFEDALFTQEASQVCALRVIREKLIVSDRKYRKHGAFKVTAIHLFLTLLWKCNLDLNRIHWLHGKFLGKKRTQQESQEELLLSPHS